MKSEKRKSAIGGARTDGDPFMDSEWVLDGLVIEGKHAMKRRDKDLNLHGSNQNINNAQNGLERTMNKPIAILQLGSPMPYSPRRRSAG